MRISIVLLAFSLSLLWASSAFAQQGCHKAGGKTKANIGIWSGEIHYEYESPGCQKPEPKATPTPEPKATPTPEPKQRPTPEPKERSAPEPKERSAPEPKERSAPEPKERPVREPREPREPASSYRN